MKVAYDVYSKVVFFTERTYKAQEVESYIMHVLTTPFNEQEKLETNRGKNEFSSRKMRQWCDDNNIMIIPNPDTPDLEFIPRGNHDNTAYDRLHRELLKYRGW